MKNLGLGIAVTLCFFCGCGSNSNSHPFSHPHSHSHSQPHSNSNVNSITGKDVNGSVHILWSVRKEKESDKHCWYYRNGPASTPFSESIKRSIPITPGFLEDKYVVDALNRSAAMGAWTTLLSGIGAKMGCPLAVLTSMTPATILPGFLCFASVVNGSFVAYNTLNTGTVRIGFERIVEKSEGSSENKTGGSQLLKLRDAVMSTAANSSDFDPCPPVQTLLSSTK